MYGNVSFHVTLAWEIPRAEEPGGLRSMKSQESEVATKPPPPTVNAYPLQQSDVKFKGAQRIPWWSSDLDS